MRIRSAGNFDAAQISEIYNFYIENSHCTFEAIYRTIPDDFANFRGRLKLAAIYISGSYFREVLPARPRFMRKHFPFDFYTTCGSHLFPLEKPEETARIIQAALLNRESKP
jgi:pimeloyl-ACP methyl ester carboxylesterase